MMSSQTWSALVAAGLVSLAACGDDRNSGGPQASELDGSLASDASVSPPHDDAATGQVNIDDAGGVNDNDAAQPPFDGATQGESVLDSAVPDSSTAESGAQAPAQDVEEALARFNIDLTETPRLDPHGEALPEDHGPLSARKDFRRFAEIAVLGIESTSLAGSDPLYIVKQTPAANNSYDTTVLHRETIDDLPWATTSGDSPETQRDAARGDVDGDGYEELVLVYKQPSDPYVQLLIVDDESGGFARSAPISVAEAGTVDLTLEAGDFDGDGLDDVAVGLVLQDRVSVVLFTSNGTTLSSSGDTLELVPQITGARLSLRMASGNLDYDNGHELGLVLNERNNSTSEASSSYLLVDDLRRDLAELDSGFVRSEVGVEVRTAKAADLDFGDIDGDGLSEVILGGLNNISWGTSDESWGYLVYALDDLASELEPVDGTYFDQTFNQLSASGQSLRMDTFFVNALDVDGDGVDEVQANQYIFDDHVNAAAWTELYRIPEGDLIFNSGDGQQHFERGVVTMAVSDVTSDGREDVIFYSQDRADIRVWGVDGVDGWSEISTLQADSVGGDSPTWPVIVPLNVDDDSIALRYTEGSHRLVFTEPVIIAALAAAPCNPDWGQNTDACTTSFGHAESTSVSTEDSHTITAGVTVGFEQEFSVFGVKAAGIEILAQVDTAATQTAGSSYTLTKRIMHTTGPIEDSVLFTTIPMDQYTYTITLHPDPELIGGEMVLSMPREPIQALVTRQFYNESVTADAPKVGADVFPHLAGDPNSYLTRSEKDAILAQADGLESSEVDVGEGGGTSSVELSVYDEVSQGSSYSVDFSLDIQATAGSVVFGASVGYGLGHTISYATGSETSYAATVSNLDAEHFNTDQYKFGLFTYIHEQSGRQFEVLNYWVHPQPQ